ncbi:hypothetical protein pb186bvf_006810 [Paramecium bursaria]
MNSKTSRQNISTAILPLSDLRNIRGHLQDDVNTDRQIEKLRLKAKSQERMEKWPNTVQQFKLKKDQFRFNKFQQDEEKRRQVDIDEAQYQATQKELVLNQANNQIYLNNDRIRRFQSNQLLSDVIQEREEQILIQKYRQEVQKQQDEIYNELLQEQLQEYDQRELQKRRLHQIKKDEQHKILKKQHDEMKDKYIQKLREERIEGELVKQKVIDAIQEDKEIQRITKLKQIQNQKDVLQGNEELKEYKQQVKLKEQHEDEIIRIYAEKKLRIQDMRKLREDLKFKEKQESRQKMIDNQIKKLQEIKDKQDNILNKQIQEAEIKAEEAERIKKEKKIQMFKVIEQSRIVKGVIKERESKSQDNQKKEFQSYWDTRNKELEHIDLIDQAKARERKIQIKQFQLQQIQEKQKTKEDQIIYELEENELIKTQKEKDDQIFHEWATIKIREQHKDGKNILPLVKALARQSQI